MTINKSDKWTGALTLLDDDDEDNVWTGDLSDALLSPTELKANLRLWSPDDGLYIGDLILRLQALDGTWKGTSSWQTTGYRAGRSITVKGVSRLERVFVKRHGRADVTFDGHWYDDQGTPYKMSGDLTSESGRTVKRASTGPQKAKSVPKRIPQKRR